MSDTLNRIETRLTEALAPVSLHIDDESALHAGHAGARDGGGHYRVDIVSAAFAGKNTVARHRMIYAALGDLMPRAIHALAIRASAPEEL
ncbi:BolA family protein [Denitromonas iodatirespirans]|uniref:BolA family transcriptional regulator n=1 Tax=Denitromonas iodatirespirans TaxID=2795389 RepID=A0A944D669_DENI1|nr:BolA family protein [Denitromonas iodatirespirans]MBT0960720.1 BolA family transcriptional regulator [Denitromonas iodatirespirans]